MKDIVIFGAGGMGKEVAWLIENLNRENPSWNILGFIEDENHNTNWGKTIYNYPVLGGYTWLKQYEKSVYVTCGVGNGTIRKMVYDTVAEIPNVKIATLIDPSVRIDKSVNIGEGSIICRNCILTVDTSIGKGVLLNIGSLVGHDSYIGDYCTFSPNSMSAGNTKIESFCELGSGSFIMQGKRVSSNTIVAPLSSVLRDIDDHGTYAGNPARRIL